jgi:CAAX prenyl protease-like protein
MRAMYLPVNKWLMDSEQGSAPTPPNPYLPPLPAASEGKPKSGPVQPSLRTNPWLVFLLPLIVFMIVGVFEPSSPAEPGKRSSGWIHFEIEYRHYPLVYSMKILLTAGAIIFVLPGYRQVLCQSRMPSARFSEAQNQSRTAEDAGGANSSLELTFVVGILGTLAWIGLAFVQKEVMRRLGWSLDVGARSAFNPLVELASTPARAYGFLAIRFVGLVLVVPFVEEMFLRGFLMRFFVAPDWWQVPIGTVNRAAIIAATVIPVLMHPGEAIAAVVWFSAVTWLLIRTRNIWPCIIAHGVTNTLMGAYVVISGHWWLM